MAINAVKKINDGFINASAITVAGLRYNKYTFSFLGTAPASNVANSAASITYAIPVTSGAIMIGHYLTKNTCASTTGSTAKVPVFTSAINSIKVSMSHLIFGADVCEGVVICIEP